MGRKTPYRVVFAAAQRCPLRRKMLPCPCLAAVAAPGQCPCRVKAPTGFQRKILKDPDLAAVSVGNR
jgi:hypothetical protein